MFLIVLYYIKHNPQFVSGSYEFEQLSCVNVRDITSQLTKRSLVESLHHLWSSCVDFACSQGLVESKLKKIKPYI